MAKISEQLKNYQKTGSIEPVSFNPADYRVSVDDSGELNFDDDPQNYAERQNPVNPWRSRSGLGPLGEMTVLSGAYAHPDFTPETYVEEAARAGFGRSRYDMQTGYLPGEDIEDVRAKAQPWYWKIGNGIMKGGVTAAATAANTVGGTIIGAASSMFELGRELFNGEDISGKKILDAGVNNFLSENTVKLQNLAEEIFPNYRTEEERSEQYQREWWKHMGTANFIGDSFLKNLGFTVGAIYGGSVWTNLIGKQLAKKLASDIMKGAVVAANGDAEAAAILKNTADALRSGAISTIDTSKLVGNLKNAAKAINKMEAKLQLYGSVIGAMGEGTTEGIMAKNEFLDEYLPLLGRSYQQNVDSIEQNLFNTPKSVGLWDVDELGNQYLTADGRKEAERLQQKYLSEYMDLQNRAQIEGDRLSSTTFLLNLPILTTSNTIQFGKLFSGGWSTARKEFALAGKSIFSKGVAEAGKYADPVLEASYAAKNNVIGNTILGSLKVGTSEAFEEMAQGTVSSGTKHNAIKNLAEYNNDGYDRRATARFADWFSNMIEGGEDYLGDIKNWQEGAIGALTGLLGLPSRVGGKWSWQGGVVGEAINARNEYNSAKSAADNLNRLVNSKEFQDRWHSYIRHQKNDDDMEEAVQKNDEYAWHNASDRMLIGDIMAFDKAGKLNDLLELVHGYANLSGAEAQSLLEVVGDDGGKKSADDVAKEVGERAKNMEQKIHQYKDVYDALATRARPGTSDKLLEEMVYTAEEIKLNEDRFLRLLDETMEIANGKFTKNDEDIAHLAEFQSNLARFFTSSVLPGRLSFREAKAAAEAMDKLAELVKGDEEAEKKVTDMIRLADDRDAFYEKLQHLQGPHGEEDLDEASTTQEKQQAEADKEALKTEVEGYTDLASVKDAYYKNNTTQKKLEFVERLRASKGTNKAVDDFVDLHDTVEGFRTKANASTYSFMNSSSTPMVAEDVYHLMLRDLLDHVNSIEELERLDPSAFGTTKEIYDEVAKRAQNSFKYPFPPTEAVVGKAMAEAQEFLRDVMEEYAKERKSATYVRSKKNIAAAARREQSQGPIPGGVPGPNFGPAQGPAVPPVPPPSFGPAESAERNEDDDEKNRLDQEEKEQRGDGSQSRRGELDDLERQSAKKERSDKDKKSAAESKNGKKMFYRTSIPEVSLDRLVARRKALIDGTDLTKKDVTLVETVKGENDESVTRLIGLGAEEKSLADVYQGLKDRNAFNNMSLVRKNDKILFVRYKNEDAKTGGFPKVGGKYVDLMCVEKVIDGKKQLLVLNILGFDTKNTKYYGLDALHKAIDNEFDAKGFDSDGKFVFSKKSTVWSLQSGMVPYGPMYWDRSIADIEGYSDDCPVILIGADGSIIPLRGEVKTSPDKIFGSGANMSGLAGRIYYLAYDTNGYTTPIRLNQEHFKTDNYKDLDTPVAKRVRAIVSEIVKIAQNAQTEIPEFKTIKGEKTEDRRARLRDYNSKLSDYRDQLNQQMKILGQILDLHRDIVTLGINSETGLLSLKITPEYKVAEKEEAKGNGVKSKISPLYFYGNTLNDESFLAGLASLDRAFNISKSMSEAEINAKIRSGVLTSNAVAMRPVGIDFYIYPFVPGEGKDGAFKAGSSIQDEVKKEKDATPAAPVTGPSEKPQDEKKKSAADDADDILKTKKKGPKPMFQVVGSRPSALSAEEREKLKEERKRNASRSARVKSELYRQLQKTNGVTNMRMDDKKLKKKLLDLGLARPVVDFLLDGIKRNPSLRNMTPLEAFIQLDSLMRYDIANEYNRNVGKKLDSELDGYLRSFLSRFGIDVREGDLSEMFGVDGVSGAFDVIEKIVWLANNPEQRNKITMPEEFAHAFVELMGSSLGYGADSEDFQFLYNTVVHTKIYEQVYAKYKDIYLDENGKPDEYLIRKEAIGQALAAGIVHNWDERKLGKTEEDKTFWNQLKEWFQKILDLFKGQNISFEQTIDDIANEILDGDIKRLVKVDDSGFKLLDYTKTIEDQNRKDGGKAVEFMQYFSSIGNLITGSLSYRRQGTVYRSKMDSLHDIDMIVPNKVHGIHNAGVLQKYAYRTRNNVDFMNDILGSPYFRKIKEKYPKIVFANVFNDDNEITVNAVYSENEELSARFARMTGNYSERLKQFTDEERDQIYLFDFFLRTPDKNDVSIVDMENKISLSGYQNAFRNKLKMGRSKDVYDYQRWRLFDEFSERRSDPRDVMFQATSIDYGQRALDKLLPMVYAEMVNSGEAPVDGRLELAQAMTVLTSKGPVRVEQAESALQAWNTPGVSYSQDASDFRLVFDSIFTDTEKAGLSDALASAYGNPASEINAYVLMNDYVMWKLSGIFDKGTTEDQKWIKSAFKRMQALENNRDLAIQNLDVVSNIVDERANRSDSYKIGMVPDTSVFANLTDVTKESLIARGWTEEQYDSAPDDIKDKALRCAGV